jgi:DNA-binding CsgD family transcriptional regulator
MATTPQRLNDRHEAAARLFAVGIRRADVARRLGYHPSTLSHVRRSADFQQKVERFQAEIREQMSAALVRRIVGGGASAVLRAKR